jgi:DNA repair protein RecN (Recombination protein N)
MIERLYVCDLALIEEVDIPIGPGLTTLTGETGAGKTMLVEALNMALGERADCGLVREGARKAIVRMHWRDADGAARVFERRLGSDGRNTCAIDGGQVTAQALSAVADGLVDLHGQHEHQRLLHQAWHADYLDRAIGEKARSARERYAEALGRAKRAAETLAQLQSAEHERDALMERLAFEIAEIEEVAPTLEEAAELTKRLPVLRHVEQLAAAVGQAHALLETSDEVARDDYAVGGSLDQLRKALALLEPVITHDRALGALYERANLALLELEDIAHDLQEYLDGLDRDPGAYERAEARAASIDRLAQRYGGTAAHVLEHAERARASLSALEGGQERVEEVRQELDAELSELRGAAQELSGLRRDAAPGFASQVQDAARALAMPAARFEVEIESLPHPMAGPDLDRAPSDGLDRVEFLFSANEGEAVRPLARIASGGELSRLMLATKKVLGRADSVETLVFDEIDAGIGGEAGVAVASALCELARDHQVLVITHLPQIAAAADHHLLVEKSVKTGRTITTVRAVQGEDLEAELARMLSGDAASDVSRRHAREILGKRSGQ